MRHTPRLLLWDIDGTLLPSKNMVHGQGMIYACEQVLHVVPHFQEFTFAGQTDRSVVTAGLRGAGVDDATIEASLEAIYEIAATYVEARCDQLLTEALPGVIEVIRRLERRGVHHALITGNLPRVAKAKLAAAGLDQYFVNNGTLIGGFGNISVDRADLVPAAIRAAEAAYGEQYSLGAIVVIGDTPNDIRAGKVHGTRTIGVATGDYSETNLADADMTFPNLSHVRAVVHRMQQVFQAVSLGRYIPTIA